MKRAVFICVTAVCSIAIVAILGELMARALVIPYRVPHPPPLRRVDPYQVNPYFFFTRPYLQVYMPGATYEAERSSFKITYRINQRGFRGPEIAVREATGLKRLVVIGDSIVEGHGVEFADVFTERLGVALRPLGWQVINAGVAGGSPIYYAANVPRYLALQPDAVLLLIFENDLTDDRGTESHVFSLPLLDDEHVLLRGAPPTTACCESRLYTWLRRMWKEVEFKRSTVGRIVARNQASPAPTDEQKEWSTIASFLIAPSMIDRQWKMSQPYLDYLAEAFRRNNVSLLIANFCLGTLAPGPNEAYYHAHCRQLDDRVAAWAKGNTLPFRSLVPEISEAFGGPHVFELMIKDDGHPTPRTHMVIERALRPWLVDYLP
jgi:lysophospholipase L1-like esterase